MRYSFLRFPGGKSKVVTLSYDDGCQEDKKLLEILDKYNLKCTFNLVGNKIEYENPLSHDFIKNNILAKGHEIAVHGQNHRAQNKVRSIAGIRDILDCRILFEKTFDTIIRGMAFPDSAINRFQEPEAYARVKGYIKDLDIAYVRSAGGDNDKFNLPEDWLNWIPTAHHDNPQIMEYIDKFIDMKPDELYSAARTAKLFFMWGHSYEFERNNNWDHLEAICQKLAGHDDVWYATCIEIYEYVKAYNSLVYSADETKIYNPTLTDVYFDVDGTPYCVKSGNYIRIDK